MLGAKFDSTKTALRDLLADPKLTFHLKESAQADLPAAARAVTDPEEKRRSSSTRPSWPSTSTGRMSKSGWRAAR